jgi:hypothetical protein
MGVLLNKRRFHRRRCYEYGRAAGDVRGCEGAQGAHEVVDLRVPPAH